tara:strand:+ start:253 stop:822 length:570 start_codon:yes stop_codon:yes gene_type:complete
LKIVLIYLIIFFILPSCQKIEVLDKIVFDYNQFAKLTIIAEEKNLSEIYEAKFIDPFIDHSIKTPPIEHLKNWIDNNLSILGTENNLVINIKNASLKKYEILNNDAKKYQEKKIFLYEINYLAEYILYDDNELLLGKTIVETNRSVTSSKFISIDESDKIIDNLIFDSLIDFTNKSEELIKIHLDNYIF